MYVVSHVLVFFTISYTVHAFHRESNCEDALDTILEEIKQRIEKREIKSNVVTVHTITQIVADLTSNDDDLNQESLQLSDAFHSPKLHFDERTKIYSMHQAKQKGAGSYNLFPTLESRTAMYRERLLLAQQRLLRNTSLRVQGLGGSVNRDGSDALEISTVESLLGATDENRVLFGMLTQVYFCLFVFVLFCFVFYIYIVDRVSAVMLIHPHTDLNCQ